MRTALILLLLACVSARGAPFAYITETGFGTVSVIDTQADRVVSTIEVGNEPLSVAVNPAGTRAYVANLADGTLSVIDTGTNGVIATVPVSEGPSAVAASPDGRRVYVAATGREMSPGSIDVLDAGSNARLGRVPVGRIPLGLAVSGDGRRLYVGNLLDQTISVVDTASIQVIATVQLASGPAGLALDPSGARLYAALAASEEGFGSTVVVIDTASLEQVATIPVGVTPLAIAMNPAGTRVYVTQVGTDARPGNTVTEIDTASNAVTATIAACVLPQGIAVHPQGHRIYVTCTEADTVSVIDAATRRVVATVPVGIGPIAWGSFIGPASAPAPNLPAAKSGLWWNPSESGWGIHLTQRRDTFFAAWYAYDAAGNPKWYVSPGCALSGDACEGLLYEVNGPRFFGVAFDPSSAVATQAGTLRIAFRDDDNATLTYAIAGSSRTVAITRQVFGASLARGPDLTDLWWNPAESGWGLAVTHQAGALFLAWYVYDASGRPAWLVAPACRISGSGCSSPLFRTSGPPAGPSFDPAQVRSTQVGTMSVFFPDSGSMTLNYTVDGIPGTKTVRRQFF